MFLLDLYIIWVFLLKNTWFIYRSVNFDNFDGLMTTSKYYLDISARRNAIYIRQSQLVLERHDLRSQSQFL